MVVIEPGAIATEWSGIAAEGLVKTSGGSAYADQAHNGAAVLSMADGRVVSPPSVIANAIAKAVQKRRPRTRYAVGAGAKPVLFLRRVLPGPRLRRRHHPRVPHRAGKLAPGRAEAYAAASGRD